MAKLTTEEIQFIDDRLYNLGVEFIDIRYEMVDHIASELETKEGNFKANLLKYFMINKDELLEQNKKAKRTAITRALKYYLKTLLLPGSMALFVVVFAAVFFCAQYYMDRFDLSMYGNCVLLILIIPFAIVSWNSKKISLMRAIVQLLTYLYLGNIFVHLITSFIDDDEARKLPQRFSISFMAAFMVVLILSLYSCRKQYVGKYIKW